MTRIETALARMRDEAEAWNIWSNQLTKMAATPTGAALAALVEAAEAAVDAYGSDGEWDAMAVLAIARTAFRAATVPGADQEAATDG